MEKSSRRSRRMTRHHKRNKSGATLNMVSLMDIFTILLLFLLVNASTESEILKTPAQIKLPESTSERSPKENIVILVGNEDITIDDKVIANTRSVLASREPIIPAVLVALEQQMIRARARKIDEALFRKRGITIMGDKHIPYELVKKIMLSCASMDFTNVSLAVVQKDDKN